MKDLSNAGMPCVLDVAGQMGKDVMQHVTPPEQIRKLYFDSSAEVLKRVLLCLDGDLRVLEH